MARYILKLKLQNMQQESSRSFQPRDPEIQVTFRSTILDVLWAVQDFEGHSRLQKELLTAAIDMVDAGDQGSLESLELNLVLVVAIYSCCMLLPCCMLLS